MESDVAMATYVYEECWIDTDKKKQDIQEVKLRRRKKEDCETRRKRSKEDIYRTKTSNQRGSS